MDLKGRVVIVTGAVGAIGHGICKVLAAAGMRVVVADLLQEECDRFAGEIKASGASALGVATDVASRESTRKMARTVLEAFGRIDV